MKTPMLRLLSTVKHFATKNPNPLKLNYVCNYGKQKCPTTITQQSLYLYKELPIRLAQRAVELENLPYDVSKTVPMQDVYDVYLRSFDRLITHEEPNDFEKSKKFTETLKQIKEDGMNIEYNISNALELFREENKDKHTFLKDIHHIDSTLENFYNSRIGIRFLIGQHVTVQQKSIKDTHVGMINIKCDPHIVIKDAAHQVTEMVDNVYCQELEFDFGFTDKQSEFLYVPSHLFYIVLEVLKNAGKATAEFNECSKPVKIRTSVSDKDFIIKISDRGGGFSRDLMNKVFSFSYTTSGTKDRDDKELQLSGYGHGLGLSRIYARYFGGDLVICPIQGVGTDVYIYLNRFGDANENVADIRT
jgi:pyruvate dehydrogenase kinase 2/3/4